MPSGWERDGAGVRCGKLPGAAEPSSPASVGTAGNIFVEGGEGSRCGCFEGELPLPFPAPRGSVPFPERWSVGLEASTVFWGSDLDASNDTGGERFGRGEENGFISGLLNESFVDVMVASAGLTAGSCSPTSWAWLMSVDGSGESVTVCDWATRCADGLPLGVF